MHLLNSSIAVQEVDVPVNDLALVKAKDGVWEQLKSTSVLNQTATFHRAYAVWMPFSLPDSEDENDLNVGGDIISQNRFQDNEELRYSLRSVERHAPWIRNIYIVTNGQIPHWLNLDNPHIFIVTHQEIFLNQSHLPTYASPAIESHIHRIPGLSKWFLYLNDDVMFGQDVWPDDFLTTRGGQKVHLSWQVPNCADGCPSNWIADRYCDVACNVSKCDWDGGDCANASKPGPVAGYHSWSLYSTSTSDYCNSGCLNNWVGDKYCDTSCRVAACGFDAGDCGVDQFPEVYSITLTEESPPNQTFVIPLETPAMYFNLSAIFDNGTISAADYNTSSIIRTAVVAQEHKTLSLTFVRNVSLTACAFSVTGTAGNAVNSSSIYFTVVVDTMTLNLTKLQDNQYDSWNFPVFNDTNSRQFLMEVADRFGDAEISKYWISQRHTPAISPLPSSVHHNYTVSNLSILPDSIAKQIQELEQQKKDGELTEKGFVKRQAVLLEPYKHLLPVGRLPERKIMVAVGHPEMESHSRHMELLRDSDGKGTTGLRQLLASESKVLSNDQSDPIEFKPHLPEPALESRRRFPWERYRVFPEERPEANIFYTSPHKGRKLLDAFSDSLIYVNKLFNHDYGYVSRRVPAHMPHMVNKEIIEDLHAKYEVEFDITSSHKLRSALDMQFAFSYFYFMMSEKIASNASAVFDEFDIDGSGILSVRELRTLLAQLYDIPVTLPKIDELEKILHDCSLNYTGTPPSVDPIEFEILYDPNLPLITRDFVLNCTALVKKIVSVFGTKNKYRYEELGEDEVAFKMLNENSSKILEHLDWLRKNQRKFICLNDDIDHSKEDSKLSQMLMQDFYESMFPMPSQFELPLNYRNKFLYTKDLREWLESKKRLQLVLHLALAVLLLVCLASLFYGKLLQIKRKVVRWMQGCLHRGRRTTNVA